MNKTIATASAPAAVGPYCQAKLCGNTLYTSGQLGIEAQAKQALENLGAVLKEAGMGYEDVVKTTCFLAQISDFAAFNAVYAQFFTGEVPARSCFAVKDLPLGGLVEIECIAVK